MKKLLLLTFLLSFALISCLRNGTETPIDKTSFLVGTLSDYMGRDKYPEVENLVDRYSQQMKPLYMAIDSMFKESYPELKYLEFTNESSNQKYYELYSNSLTDKIDEYYNYTPSERGHINADMDTIPNIDKKNYR